MGWSSSKEGLVTLKTANKGLQIVLVHGCNWRNKDFVPKVSFCMILEAVDTLGFQTPPEKVFGPQNPTQKTFSEAVWKTRDNLWWIGRFFETCCHWKLLLPEETGWSGFRVARRLWALDLPLIFCSLAFSESNLKFTHLKLTWHLKMDGWNTSFLLGWPIFRGYVSFR